MSLEFQSVFFDTPIVNGRVIDFFIPEAPSRDVALFFVHGGGWRAGSRTIYYHIIEEYMNRGFICATTDYRLGGVSAFEQIFDIRCGYDLFISKLKELNRPLKIFTHGSSAGAHLNAMVSLTTPGECGEPCEFKGTGLKNAWVKPIGAALQATPVTFEPWEDIFPHIWASMVDIAGAAYEEHPDIFKRLSPCRYINDGSPALFFMEAENEHMFPGAMTQEVVDMLRRLGIKSQWKVYPRTEHGFFYDLTRRQQREAFEDIIGFIDSL